MSDSHSSRERGDGPGDGAPDGDVGDDDGYSATALGSHWFERPESRPTREPRTEPIAVPGTGAEPRTEPNAVAKSDPDARPTTIAEQPEPEPEPGAGAKAEPGAGSGRRPGPVDRPDSGSATPIGRAPHFDAVPDRVEGEVLRFGPGVPPRPPGTTPAPAPAPAPRDGVTTAVWHGAVGGARPGPPRGHRRRPRRYLLAATVLVAVLAALAWQRYGTPLSVTRVRVQPPAPAPGCDGTADVVGVVRTNGRPGTLVYRWERSDGTASGQLREKLSRGQEEAKVSLLWSFRGRGEYRASVELRIISPSAHRSTTRFVYRCD